MRYQAIQGSQSSHCCYDATVIDTSIKLDIKGGVQRYKAICECFDMSDAVTICEAMNDLDTINKVRDVLKDKVLILESILNKDAK